MWDFMGKLFVFILFSLVVGYFAVGGLTCSLMQGTIGAANARPDCPWPWGMIL